VKRVFAAFARDWDAQAALTVFASLKPISKNIVALVGAEIQGGAYTSDGDVVAKASVRVYPIDQQLSQRSMFRV
jgi:hypothetical protein